MPENFIEDSSDTILLGEKLPDQDDFYHDENPARLEFERSKLDLSKHSAGPGKTGTGGSIHAFADGSARFIKFGESFAPVNLWVVTPELR